MTHTCTQCGHVDKIEPQQARAGKALWANTTKEERSVEMSRRRLKGMVQKACDDIPKSPALVKNIEKRLKSPSEA